jgi:hypothetical protein
MPKSRFVEERLSGVLTAGRASVEGTRCSLLDTVATAQSSLKDTDTASATAGRGDHRLKSPVSEQPLDIGR